MRLITAEIDRLNHCKDNIGLSCHFYTDLTATMSNNHVFYALSLSSIHKLKVFPSNSCVSAYQLACSTQGKSISRHAPDSKHTPTPSKKVHPRIPDHVGNSPQLLRSLTHVSYQTSRGRIPYMLRLDHALESIDVNHLACY